MQFSFGGHKYIKYITTERNWKVWNVFDQLLHKYWNNAEKQKYKGHMNNLLKLVEKNLPHDSAKAGVEGKERVHRLQVQYS